MKTEIKSKIKLIYDLELKFNTTCNLARNCAQNDLINHQIQVFSFRDFENKIWRSIDDFFQFTPPNLDFKHSSEMTLEEEEIKRFKDWVVKKIKFSQNIQEWVFLSKNTLIYRELGCDRWICLFVLD